jgi:hypothetical protein
MEANEILPQPGVLAGYWMVELSSNGRRAVYVKTQTDRDREAVTDMSEQHSLLELYNSGLNG